MLTTDDPFFSTTFLFEVGGNIGERRVSHEADMAALVKVNPKAKWIVKTLKPH